MSPFNNINFFDNFQNSSSNTYTLNEYKEFSRGWWTYYNDPELNHLVEKLLSQNIELKIAAERLVQTEEQINITRAELLPTLSGNTSAARQATPNNGNFGDFPGASDKNYNTNYDLGISAAWQLDLFGEIRNQTESNKATYLASVANRDAIIQSLIAQLVICNYEKSSVFQRC